MPRFRTSRTVYPATADRLLRPREDIVAEVAADDGHFTLGHGPFDHYERYVATERLAPTGAPETLPKTLPPMLAEIGENAKTNGAWRYEPKLDGYRVIAFVEDGKVRLQSRRGLDLTNGSYKGLVTRFNMPEDDYKKFLSFLRKYQSHLPIQDFRTAHADLNGSATERAAGE